MTTRRWLALASFFIMTGIIAGAFGAHALKDSLDPYSKDVYEKAIFYLFVNALGLMSITLGASTGIIGERALSRSGYLIALGILLFSGSLVLLALTGQKWLGAVTPLGGVSFILGWALVSWDTFRNLRE